MAFADEYQGVEAHGNTKFHVIHTNDKKQMAITLAQYERHLSLQRHKIVGIDHEYNNEPEATQKPALCQLSIGKKHPVLLFQLSAAERLLHRRRQKRLVRVNLEVANFVDFQKEWRVPEATKELDSLGDVFGMLIDEYYNNMKKKITDDEHKHWATLPLSMRHIEYAEKDAYTAYEI
uniref:3'-5' exonuclease domain-containing protein n=1 Tax=Aegilops tauschii TaxID=37682 RepID=M8BZN8_AEGTA